MFFMAYIVFSFVWTNFYTPLDVSDQDNKKTKTSELIEGDDKNCTHWRGKSWDE